LDVARERDDSARAFPNLDHASFEKRCRHLNRGRIVNEHGLEETETSITGKLAPGTFAAWRLRHHTEYPVFFPVAQSNRRNRNVGLKHLFRAVA